MSGGSPQRPILPPKKKKVAGTDRIVKKIVKRLPGYKGGSQEAKGYD